MAGSVNKVDPFIMARFLSNVDFHGSKSACWEWRGNTNNTGYGRFSYKDIFHLAHRFSFRLFFGEIPSGYFVCHSCDNRKCINPEHLWLGSASDNIKDAVSKGRHKSPDTRADKNGNTPLSWGKVNKIREMHLNGVRKFHLAKLFGVSPSTISNITNFETWKGDGNA